MIPSDRSLKEDIEPAPDEVIASLLQLNPIMFKMKGGSKTQYGFIAQDIEGTPLASIVYKNDRGIRSVAYTQLISILVSHIQQLTKRVAALESR